MKLIVLGCGDAFSSGGRRNTSFLIQANSQHILMDFGATSIQGMKSLHIDPVTIDMVFVSHFHGDHFGGIPFLIINRKYNQPSQKKLTFVGPKGLKWKIKELQRIMYPDTEDLIDDPTLSFIEFETNKNQLIGGIGLWSTEVLHSPPSQPHGYKLKIDGKIIGYSGDTAWTDRLYDLSNDCDLFICECNDLKGEVPGHLSFDLLAPHLSKFNCKKVMLTHMGEEILNANVNAERLSDGLIIEV